jgi:sterol desaturase/sphingolipid hydroxylase (fatty acid hydroxylase superfamily)
MCRFATPGKRIALRKPLPARVNDFGDVVSGAAAMEQEGKFSAIASQLRHVLLSPGSDFSLLSLAAAFCVAFGFLAHRHWRRRRRFRPRALLRAIFRRRLVFNRSTYADMAYFYINGFAAGGLLGWGMLEAGGVAKGLVTALRGVFGALPPIEAPEFLLRAALTLALFLAYEFGYYLDHYLKHRVPFLWELHKTHHSAQTLTPWTVWRVHPLDMMVFTNILAITIGGTAGVFAFLAGRGVDAFNIDGANAILVCFVFAYVHLQHSQFWIPFTGALGRVLMSPAHHQLHHSSDPAHFDRNFGSCLALWDWMFGTLRVPQTQAPRLCYGVDMAGADPHSLITLLITPVQRAIAALAPKRAIAQQQTPALR